VKWENPPSSAFVNYTKLLKKPASVIPASFITTVGFHFDEIKINIGDPDPNENFNEQGASVTQHCRSYIIPLRSDLHLRLIDTPGMGDTRGIEQDMKNIDHILSYVDQFSHLDAVCFLLKPDVSRLNIFFRSCLRQLFTYLTPEAYDNIAYFVSPTHDRHSMHLVTRVRSCENCWLTMNGMKFVSESRTRFASIVNHFDIWQRVGKE
jgi:hypothetical protein